MTDESKDTALRACAEAPQLKLVDYVEHRRGCKVDGNGDPPHPCTCGLDNLLAACAEAPATDNPCLKTPLKQESNPCLKDLWQTIYDAAANEGSILHDDTVSAIEAAIRLRAEALASPEPHPPTVVRAFRHLTQDTTAVLSIPICRCDQQEDDGRAICLWCHGGIPDQTERARVAASQRAEALEAPSARTVRCAPHDKIGCGMCALEQVASALAVTRPRLCTYPADDGAEFDFNEVDAVNACIDSLVTALSEKDATIGTYVAAYKQVIERVRELEVLALDAAPKDEACRCAKPAPLEPGAKCRKCHRWTVAAVEADGSLRTVPSKQDAADWPALGPSDGEAVSRSQPEDVTLNSVKMLLDWAREQDEKSGHAQAQNWVYGHAATIAHHFGIVDDALSAQSAAGLKTP